MIIKFLPYLCVNIMDGNVVTMTLVVWCLRVLCVANKVGSNQLSLTKIIRACCRVQAQPLSHLLIIIHPAVSLINIYKTLHKTMSGC